MTIGEFRTYTTLYGSDLSVWPVVLRHKAHVALQKNAALQMVINEEAAFEDLLATRQRPPAPYRLEERIVAQAATQNQDRDCVAHAWSYILKALWSDIAWPRPALVFPALVLLGALLGFVWAGATASDTQPTLAALFQVDGALL